MKMGDCEPSYGYGKAHVVSGHWFSPWHTGREPNLSNPFQGLFFWPGFLRGFLRGFWLFLPPPWTVQNGEWTVQGYSPLKKAWKTYVRTHVRTHVTTHVKVSERFVGK